MEHYLSATHSPWSVDLAQETAAGHYFTESTSHRTTQSWLLIFEDILVTLVEKDFLDKDLPTGEKNKKQSIGRRTVGPLPQALQSYAVKRLPTHWHAASQTGHRFS